MSEGPLPKSPPIEEYYQPEPGEVVDAEEITLDELLDRIAAGEHLDIRRKGRPIAYIAPHDLKDYDPVRRDEAMARFFARFGGSKNSQGSEARRTDADRD